MKWWGSQSQRTWGQLTLGIWLIGTGLLPLSGVVVPHGGEILALLAVASGVLILMRR